MNTRYDSALWRPLGPQIESSITPRVLIFHTMVATLPGVDRQFRAGGFSGTESTFGVGGPWEGASYDGVVYQWQDLGHAADAQWDGNSYANSVETSDGGHPDNPWSPKQLDALVKLTVWWCRTTGNPGTLVGSTSGHGLGYHRQFYAWNHSNHSCPGNVRLAQLTNVIIPRVHAVLAGHVAPAVGHAASKPVLPVVPYVGPYIENVELEMVRVPVVQNGTDDTKISGSPVWNLQLLLRLHGGKGADGKTPIVVDGVAGTDTAAAIGRFQAAYHLPVTGKTDAKMLAFLMAA